MVEVRVCQLCGEMIKTFSKRGWCNACGKEVYVVLKSEFGKKPDIILKDLIKKHAEQILTAEDPKLFFKPDIPQKKLSKAIEQYAKNVLPENVIALYDSTVWGASDEGFIITEAGFYYRQMLFDPIEIKFNSIDTIRVKDKKIIIKHDNKESEIETVYLNNLKVKEFLDDVIIARDFEMTEKHDGIVIVEDMPDTVKLNYLKVIILLTFDDDGVIDQSELAEIQTLMAQLKFSAELRADARKLILNPKVSFSRLLKDMDKDAPELSKESLHFSLLKDMIRVFRSTNDYKYATKSNLILSVAAYYGIPIKVISFFQEVCAADEKILKGEVTDSQIKGNAEKLAVTAGGLGVPIAAVYMSGSVVGLSAAGVSSGLAALGLGGILGFSSMITGTGVVLIAGAGIYKGAKWLFSGNRKGDNVQQRVFMLNEVIKLNQLTINNLVDDINYFAELIVELTMQSKIDKKLIEKTGKEIGVFKNAMHVLKVKGINVGEIINESR